MLNRDNKSLSRKIDRVSGDGGLKPSESGPGLKVKRGRGLAWPEKGVNKPTAKRLVKRQAECFYFCFYSVVAWEKRSAVINFCFGQKIHNHKTQSTHTHTHTCTPNKTNNRKIHRVQVNAKQAQIWLRVCEIIKAKSAKKRIECKIKSSPIWITIIGLRGVLFDSAHLSEVPIKV